MPSRVAIVWRAAAFLALWLILVGGPDPADRPAGIIAIVAATWASRRLLPPRGMRPSAIALVGIVLRFLRRSIVAGLDVGWRALDPRLPLRPGFIHYQAHLPPGQALHAFCTLESLAPGTLAAGPNEEGIVVHCLDVSQPLACDLAADERLLARALGGGGIDG